MGNRTTLTVLLCTLVLLALTTPLYAQWILNGTEICTEDWYQSEPAITADGYGGAIIVWSDSRNWTVTEYDLYAQRIDSYGNILWTTGGIVVSDADMDQWKPRICPDRSGGAFIVFENEQYGSATDIGLVHIDSGGNVLWTYCVACNYGDQWDPQIISDGEGGCIVAFDDYQATYGDIYAQRFDYNGTLLWGLYPLLVSGATQHQYKVQLCPDGQHGAIFTWTDLRSAVHIYAQRVDADGDYRWTVNGTPVCEDNNLLYAPQIVADGHGGAIITWYDSRHVSYWAAYAQRVSSIGAKLWTTNGVRLSGTAGDAYESQLVSDSEGGAIVTWEDRRGTSHDIYVQRILYNGITGWGPSGTIICNAAQNQDKPHIAVDGDGGAIITWKDYRSTTADIYAQRIGHYSALHWTANGVPVCTEGTSDQRQMRLCPDEGGGAIITWTDHRNDLDIYAQRIERLGFWGYPSPAITGVTDVGGDQGGWVQVDFDKSRLDFGMLGQVDEYSIWRRLSGEQVALLLEQGETGVEIGKLSKNPEGPMYHFTSVNGTLYGWEFLEYVDATGLGHHTHTEPTHYDSIAGDTGWHHFKVIAHGEDQLEFWESQADSGYSVDNLAPSPPSGSSAEQSYNPEGLKLKWNANHEPDFSHYGVYKGTPSTMHGEGAMLDRIELLGTTQDTTYFDETWRWWEDSYHIITAFDNHGNESRGDSIFRWDITGDDPPAVPPLTYLEQNYPNPFNPSTTIHFGIDVAADVSLRIYDASGRVIRDLVNEKRKAAVYDETWDGRDNLGRPAASGIYFYRLRAGDFIETKKMVLTR